MKSNKAGGRRIVELARLRNDALKSLFNGKATKRLGIEKFDIVLFMNDVFWCTGDMLEVKLIYELGHLVGMANRTTDYERTCASKVTHDLCHRLGCYCGVRPVGGKNHVRPVSRKFFLHEGWEVHPM